MCRNFENDTTFFWTLLQSHESLDGSQKKTSLTNHQKAKSLALLFSTRNVVEIKKSKSASSVFSECGAPSSDSEGL